MIRAKQNQTGNTIRKYNDAKCIICNSCLWCASYLSGNDNNNGKCPTCRSDKIELIPISEMEAYRIDVHRSGIAMEFWNVQEITNLGKINQSAYYSH